MPLLYILYFDMYILGISAFYHDSAACLIENGKVLAAAQEERFTRVKHDSSFPLNAVYFCLSHTGITLKDVSYVVFYEKPFIKFERIIQTFLHIVPYGFSSFIKAIPSWLKEKLFQKKHIIEFLKKFDDTFSAERLLFTDHHRAHAASAYFPSPFDNALIIVMDAVGEWKTTSIGIGDKSSLQLKEGMHFPHSIGLLYTAFTYFLGFKVNSGEYKVMGLAPYGKPTYEKLIYDHLIKLSADGSFELNLYYFNYLKGLTMTDHRLEKLLGIKRRKPEGELTQAHFDIAASIQKVTESLVLGVVGYAVKKYPNENLCLAGGVALNCVSNQKIAEFFHFKEIYVQPAAGDAGGAMGAALDVWYSLHPDRSKKISELSSTYLGAEYTIKDIALALDNSNLVYEKVESMSELAHVVADYILEDKIVGLFQGRAEFGPRALGNRSILGNAFSSDIQTKLNLNIKFRESFRPFAPAVLQEDLFDIFDSKQMNAFMLFTAKVKDNFFDEATMNEMEGLKKLNVKRSLFQAVVHVDGTSRYQSVNADNNLFFNSILEYIKKRTGYGIVANTSFNVRGEPIVNSPEDAVNCFKNTNMDFLVIGPFVVSRKINNLEEIREKLDNNYD